MCLFAVCRLAADQLPQDKHGRNLVLHCIQLQSHIEELDSLLDSGREDGEGSSTAANTHTVPSYPSQHWWSVEDGKLPRLPSERPEIM